METEVWLERRQLQTLDCPYHHVIYTISHDLHAFWQWNRRLFTNLLFLAAWHSLRELLESDRRLGARPGVIAVFQSWDDHLKDHCHLHFIVTAGGLDKSGKWRGMKSDRFLIPSPALAAKFRGKFLAYLREAFEKFDKHGDPRPKTQTLVPPGGMSVQKCLNLLNKLGRIRWHVDIEPAQRNPETLYKYLGRYIRQGPISEKRIVSYDGQTVVIAYAHPEKHDRETFSLDAQVFIRRILSHVPAKGTHLVRSYGLFAAASIKKLNQARAELGQPPYEPITELPRAQELLLRMFPEWEAIKCPFCGKLLRTVHVDRNAHAPPLALAA
jgi:Putative transposase